MKKIILLLFILNTLLASGQDLWKKINPKNSSTKENLARSSSPKNFEIYSLNNELFKNNLKNVSENVKKIIPLPTAEGKIEKFSIKETSNFSSKLAAKYGYIKSFTGQCINNPSIKAKISIGLDGIHVTVYTKKGTFYVDPYTKDFTEYIAYKRQNLLNNTNYNCLVNESEKSNALKKSTAAKSASDGFLRTYRLALACTGEYAQFHLNNQGIPDTASDATKKAAVLSAMNTTITRVNGIYERDLSVKMTIVVNNSGENELIFLDSATDNFTNNDSSKLLTENQTKCDNIIGSSNYDVGHVFSTASGGLAALGVVCVSGEKAHGTTGTYYPSGDAFDVDFVSHEIGHQFGAHHTFNGSDGNCSGANRNNNTAVEPGSGSTIMGYAGLCSSQNIQSSSDDYFHAISITEILNAILPVTCPTKTSTGNIAPIVNAGADVSIPKSTPFVLKGEATDDEGTANLTYCWEQIDNEVNYTTPPISTNTGGAMFRSLPPSSSPNRYMPTLATVISGSTASEWEVVPSVARDLNFSLIVRDNHTGGGASTRDDIKVTVTNANPFTVTSQNTNVAWAIGSTQTITWDKSTTNIAPINCANVNIKLSTDGGVTFPITLKANTPNDGSESITVPNNATSTARIMVEAADNIFYNINSTDFTIGTPEYCTSNYTDDTNGKEYIANVTFNTINNTSGNAATNGYEDFTNISTSVKKGQTYNISVAFDVAGFQDHCYVFIDWNGDFNFDTTNERYDLGILYNNSTPASLNKDIIVPNDAIIGSTRMRVNIEYTNTQTSNLAGEGACDSDHTSEWGETEDYTLNIENNTTNVENFNFNSFNLYPNPSNGTFNLTFEVVNTDKVSILLFDLMGRLVEEKQYLDTSSVFSEKLNYSKIASGLYFLKIKNGGKQIIKKVIVK
ncbi:reprolysin-like metallopeptidase [Tenacibaculum sp. UWU-22]|uniref:reprolysin-like metallopeptidase n=1 Tax=Tenacibaculum sp. UWU-22 TaxID=3234187 RepID=UPI0034DB39EA